MSLRHIWIVFKKEVRDIVRDKKTLLTSILIPMIIIPLLNLIVGGSAEKFQKDLSENIEITLAQDSRTNEIKALVQNEIIKDFPNIQLVETDDAQAAVKEGRVRVALDLEKGYEEKLKSGKTFSIAVIYDKNNTKSAAAVNLVQAAIDSFNKKIVVSRVTALGANPELLEPARMQANDIGDVKQGGNMMLMMMLPMMMGILMVVGGIPAATDLVAGEKERNTFEPLLTTKPGRTSILLGKYMTVTLFSFASVLATVGGFGIGYLINPKSMSMGLDSGSSGFWIPGTALLLVILISIMQGMTFAGIQIALSTYAKSFKEAQTYLSFLIFVAMIPSYSTMFMQPGDVPAYMFAIPILNTISSFKVILGGIVNYANLALALASSVVYVVITLWLAASLFNKEKVLFRS